jgi:hypothetical protein
MENAQKTKMTNSRGRAAARRLRNAGLEDLNGVNIYRQVLRDVLRKGTCDSSIQCHTQTTKT